MLVSQFSTRSFDDADFVGAGIVPEQKRDISEVFGIVENLSANYEAYGLRRRWGIGKVSKLFNLVTWVRLTYVNRVVILTVFEDEGCEFD